MSKGKGIRAAQAKATRSLLVEAAHRLFAENGFHATATNEIVKAAGVTRGALQHYFPRKEDLFRAVFEQAGRGLVQTAAERVKNEGWEGFIADLKDFIGNVASLESQRIAFIDGPAVLGWSEWRRLQLSYGEQMVTEAIADGVAKGLISPQSSRALAHLILSMIEEASLMVLNADKLLVTTNEVEFAMLSLLTSLNRHRVV
ncbi:TetR/AcrR family transcriptional regulator [Sphingomonas oligophenolica]|uniref:TetR/AcrR family transcriptional regulator n=1 Tax=Sphingomonas oligophenolica TaxID=301154 RepID=A0ABU9YCX8_9SPHN